MKFAAIDIGSNAIRLQVTSVFTPPSGVFYKKLEYVRFPMRLGEDVFNKGRLSPEQKRRFLKLMKAFQLLIELYEVDDYKAYATSALREATNGRQVIELVKKETGIEINIIDGEAEARMINDAIAEFIDDKAYLHIDVGGGSTELNIYSKGKVTGSASFKLGSVRNLQHYENEKEWSRLKAFIRDQLVNKGDKITAIGTGGNINKMFELAKINITEKLKLEKLKEVYEYVENLSMEERILEMQLNPDRADVIVPASRIYIKVMKWAGCTEVIVPNSGLKDGIMIELFNKHKHLIKTV